MDMDSFISRKRNSRLESSEEVTDEKRINDSESDEDNSEKSDESDYESETSIHENDSAVQKLSHKRETAQGFIEDEAALSGSEESSDEDEDEPDEMLENEEEYEDIPKNSEVLRDQIGKIHLKYMQDDDDRFLNIVKNDFLDEGEFHADGGRKKKFSWANKDPESEAAEKVNSSDSDEDNVDNLDQSEHLDKLKWRNEMANNLSNESNEILSPTNGNLKMKIFGKSNVSITELKKDVSLKRKRGSLMNSEGLQTKKRKELATVATKQGYFFKNGLS